ncbi:MAG TPA: hypothetical protein VME43_27350 [Bryobacteraceae bacterium]|nr:hypothetical protein [Bryobacteraceae bacterium]
MDNLQPPEELQHLWLDRRPENQSPERIVRQVLVEARRHQRRARAADLVVIAAHALFLPLMLLFAWAFLDQAPLVAAGHLVWAVTMVAGLVAYRIFYRSLGEEPPPNATSREYIEHSIEFLNRRERLLVKSAAPISALEAVAGILFAWAAVKGQESELSLLYVVLCFLAQPVSWWWTLRMQRSYSRKRTRLRQILADLGN